MLVKSFTRTGGMERYVVELALGLLKLGHSVDIYAREADEEILKEGFGFHRVPMRFGFSGVLRAVSFANETTKMLRNRSYDIVHSHERGYSEDVLSIHCFSYKEGIEKIPFLRKIDKKYLSPRSLLYLSLEKKQMKTPWLVTVSEAISDDCERQYGRHEQVVVIPPGVDRQQFSPDRVATLREEQRTLRNIRNDHCVILFVGSEFRRKGLDHLIPSIKKGMRLLVVGRGERLDHYKKLAHKIGNTKRVFFEGLSSEIGKYYAMADLVVLPSLSEAFGMSILEGMACGLPVVVSANSGVSALITDRENGYILQSFADLPKILEDFYESGNRGVMGKNARKTAEEYTWERVASEHEQLYTEIVSEKSTGLL